MTVRKIIKQVVSNTSQVVKKIKKTNKIFINIQLIIIKPGKKEEKNYTHAKKTSAYVSGLHKNMNIKTPE